MPPSDPMPYEHLGESLATDYFFVREQFDDEQWAHFIDTRRFVDTEVLPAINDYWVAEEMPWPLIRRLPELGPSHCRQRRPRLASKVHPPEAALLPGREVNEPREAERRNQDGAGVHRGGPGQGGP